MRVEGLARSSTFARLAMKEKNVTRRLQSSRNLPRMERTLDSNSLIRLMSTSTSVSSALNAIRSRNTASIRASAA